MIPNDIIKLGIKNDCFCDRLLGTICFFWDQMDFTCVHFGIKWVIKNDFLRVQLLEIIFLLGSNRKGGGGPPRVTPFQR